MTAADLFCGWDLGGAHLKLVVVAADGSVAQVEQQACPLWRGVSHLDTALERLMAELPPGLPWHAVTMTGELADLFPDRHTGVRQLLRSFLDHAGEARTLVYTGTNGLVSPARAERAPGQVASANWRATADTLAQQLDNGLLIDIGSTTADIVPFSDGHAQAQGGTDAERLSSEELVYTGVVRTPVMALADKVPFAGRWQALMAENFATTADIYRLTGELPAHADLMDAADGTGKTVTASARRLARMLGSDLDAASLADWRAVAGYLRESQLQRLNDACARVLSRRAGGGTRFVGAGVGRFLAAELAQRWRRPYLEYGHWLAPPTGHAPSIADCAPAAAVATLARDAALLDKENFPKPAAHSTG